MTSACTHPESPRAYGAHDSAGDSVGATVAADAPLAPLGRAHICCILSTAFCFGCTMTTLSLPFQMREAIVTLNDNKSIPIMLEVHVRLAAPDGTERNLTVHREKTFVGGQASWPGASWHRAKRL